MKRDGKVLLEASVQKAVTAIILVEASLKRCSKIPLSTGGSEMHEVQREIFYLMKPDQKVRIAQRLYDTAYQVKSSALR